MYEVINIVGVMSYIKRMLYHRKSGYDDTHTLAVMSYTMDMMSNIADEISEIQLARYHQYSGCDYRDTVDTISNIVGVMSYKWRFDVIV